LIDAILPTRVVRDRPGSQIMKYRSGGASMVAPSGVVGFIGSDRRGAPLFESPWDGSLIEEKYGRALLAQLYGVRKYSLCGVLVDLFV
jgi:hypothetical protein